jgi:hypothetical protein
MGLDTAVVAGFDTAAVVVGFDTAVVDGDRTEK